MKSPRLITPLFLLGFILVAQITQAQRHRFGIDAGACSSFILQETLAGGPSYELGTGYSLGLQYQLQLSNRLFLVTGVRGYHNRVTLTPAFHPDIDRTSQQGSVDLITIPVGLQLKFGRVFFVHGGILGDIDLRRSDMITTQSGLGTAAGIGADIPLSSTLSLQVMPYINAHGVLLTSHANYPQRILDSGIRVTLLMQR